MARIKSNDFTLEPVLVLNKDGAQTAVGVMHVESWMRQRALDYAESLPKGTRPADDPTFKALAALPEEWRKAWQAERTMLLGFHQLTEEA